MLAITLWFHWAHLYGGTAYAGRNCRFSFARRRYGWPAGEPRRRRQDHVHGQVQFKADVLSALWAMAALVLAAFVAEPLSVGRILLKREF